MRKQVVSAVGALGLLASTSSCSLIFPPGEAGGGGGGDGGGGGGGGGCKTGQELTRGECPPEDAPTLLVKDGETAILDTSQGTLTDNDLAAEFPATCKGEYVACEGLYTVYRFASLEVESGGTLEVKGTPALVLLVRGTATIDGLIDVSADGATPGPGGFEAGTTCASASMCACEQEPIVCWEDPGDACPHACGASGDQGGAGGSHAGRGGISMEGQLNTGSRYGLDLPELLVGGAGGGSTGSGSGGGGGGAVQISAGARIVISGVIDASGGGATVIPRGPGDLAKGGSGGGAGGTIFLEAPVVESDSARLGVLGGSGASGEYDVEDVEYSAVPGVDGTPFATAVVSADDLAMIQCGTVPGSGSSLLSPDGRDGESVCIVEGMYWGAGGGGGGASGRIHVRADTITGFADGYFESVGVSSDGL